MIKVIELFSGVGAIRKALINQKISYKIQFISEIDNVAVSAYRALFSDKKVNNFGDICKITNAQLIPYLNKCDLLCFGSPCQDFSHAGNNLGGKQNSNTRSSLLWEAVRVIETIKPKVVIFENVKNIRYSKHKQVLDQYLNYMKKNGYHNLEPFLLNALDFGIPQNRERVFCISYLGKKINHEVIINNLLNHYQNRPTLKKFLNITNFTQRVDLIRNKIEFHRWTNFATWTAKSGNQNGSYNRAWLLSKYCGTLSVCNIIKITNGSDVSKLTPQEAFKLMGFTTADFNKIKKHNICSDNKLHSLAGNSIVIPVLQNIIQEIVNNELFKSAKDICQNSQSNISTQARNLKARI